MERDARNTSVVVLKGTVIERKVGQQCSNKTPRWGKNYTGILVYGSMKKKSVLWKRTKVICFTVSFFSGR